MLDTAISSPWIPPAQYTGQNSVEQARSKILAVKQALTLFPYVLWLDADAMFARFDLPVLHRLLSLSIGKDVLFSSEFDQPRNATDASIEAMQAPNWMHWHKQKEQSGIVYWQQAHTSHWLEHIRVLHYRYFNSLGEEYQEGDLVYHVAGGLLKLNKFATVLEKCCKFNCRSKLWKLRFAHESECNTAIYKDS
ncbi:hypothetical protein DUNSADRAFT_15646 [Dunaliella salina]|uniref:Nucleotide-diphospho-sugar transferase domain-containing protein n=1 Tax=Dunaliella salina TaxID=3046 RepID=A0ABQ7G508_DUNSA|nr:hypothetical protein DUNSADRAFT_15646 [Dunaliella salina]|eukprot:KAF5829689.1 hypothetical protein DUNSADRAFT_15646 [Dunaliella salina]